MLPENGAPHGRERWYSFDWGDIHFVGLDTEKTGEVQAAWLDADLAKTTRTWTIVYAHRPPFSSGWHGSDVPFGKHFVPVLNKHHVPLVFCGHEHDYERTKRIDGTTYVVTGGGGRTTRSVGSSTFTAFATDALHFVYVTVEKKKLTMHAIDAEGREFDSAVLQK